MFTEDQLYPISALQHYLFCPRQCALIHLERVWEENQFTAEGNIVHRNVHGDRHESRPGIKYESGLHVRSRRLGIVGKTDLVEFHGDGTTVPIEYKRGKPKKNQCDEVQLCAQTLCLEEMLQLRIDVGYIYYNKRKRRTKVIFDEQLRKTTVDTIQQFQQMIASRMTPSAVREKKCDTCSLLRHCMPDCMRFKSGASQYNMRTLAKSDLNLGPKTDELEAT